MRSRLHLAAPGTVWCRTTGAAGHGLELGGAAGGVVWRSRWWCAAPGWWSGLWCAWALHASPWPLLYMGYCTSTWFAYSAAVRCVHAVWVTDGSGAVRGAFVGAVQQCASMMYGGGRIGGPGDPFGGSRGAAIMGREPSRARRGAWWCYVHGLRFPTPFPHTVGVGHVGRIRWPVRMPCTHTGQLAGESVYCQALARPGTLAAFWLRLVWAGQGSQGKREWSAPEV